MPAGPKQKETTIEQIQRGDALTVSLDPEVRHLRTRLSGELFRLVHQFELRGCGTAVIFGENGLRAIAIASDQREDGTLFSGASSLSSLPWVSTDAAGPTSDCSEASTPIGWRSVS